MDMSLDIQTLAPLFELSRDAVIGTENDIVRFANPAAAALLSVRPGDAAAQHLPEEIVSDPSICFVATGIFRGRSINVSVTRSGGFSLYTLPHGERQARSDPLLDSTLAELGTFLLTDRLALDRLLSGVETEALRPYAATLYQTYYRLKRLHSHAALATAIHRGELRSSAQLVELDRLFAGVCDTVDALVRSAGITVHFTEGDGEFPAKGDAKLLETMLLNLLSNSLLHITGEAVIRVSLNRQGDRYVLAVDDPGSGMSPERLAALFSCGGEVDMTDAAAGSGLGLIVVRGIAEAHGGVLLAESRPGQGARIRVSLPTPRPEDQKVLQHPAPSYRSDGMDLALTELSVALDKSFYTRKLMD